MSSTQVTNSCNNKKKQYGVTDEIKTCLPVKELNYSEGGWVCLGGRHPVKPALPYMDEMMVFVCLQQNKNKKL